MLWIDGSVPFPLVKDGFGVLANCSLCGIEATLSFSAGPLCSRFSAEACAILQALCWSRQHLQFCHFSSLLLLSDSCSVLATLFSPSSFLLPQFLSETVSSLLQFYQTAIGPQTLVSSGRRRRTDFRLMSWPDGERYLLLQQSLIVTLLLSLVSTFLFSRTRGVLSHLNSLTHKFPRFPPRNLCFYVMLAMFSLAFAATDTAFC